MKFGSLFTGIGGFDLGFERAGLECAWQVEIDDACQNVERRHWPSVKRFGDVQNVGRDSLDSVDLICGGFPCQDVSVAGKRAGLAGERSGLWYEFHRILEELKPQWVVIENVPGLLSSEDGRDFAAILQGLVQLRYGVAWRVLDAQYFGVAQRRRRVFVVGSLGDGRAAQVLFEREGGAGDTPPSREAGARLAATIASRFAGASNQWPPINEADNLIAWDNGQGDPNADHDGTAFALNGQANQGVAYTLPASARGTGDGHGNGWNSNYIINSFKKRGGFG
jgi:DNA (cytosine-5)-methyltransferase 1